MAAPSAPLPIDAVLPELLAALARSSRAVLQAPPGAGKTTRVPLALLAAEPGEAAWLGGGKIVMLEPRRLAARAAARRMAQTLGERPGETVGHRVRLDTCVGPRTRVEVVTEGVLARMLQDDPALEGVAAVIFDEFHERSLHADAGLALTLETQAVLREDLRVLVMSATLEGERVAGLLGTHPPPEGGGTGAASLTSLGGSARSGEAPIVTSSGRAFPVAHRWLGRRVGERVEPQVASAVRVAIEEAEGDVLVFLPGMGEIRRVESLLAGGLPPHVDLRPLYGQMAPDEQDRAILPSPSGRRKVVLATSIAETSLTIEGVRVVVDSGLARVPRFSPRSGMTRLETVRVSRASAEQRAGRAGRTAPGVCLRLWSEAEHAGLVPHSRPEILEADLAPLALELAAAGIRDPNELRWLDPPPDAAYAQARTLLAELGALDAEGRVTAHGRRMARLALHPRLAHMLLAAHALGPAMAALAADVAALLGDRDVLRGEGGPPDADLRIRLDLLRESGGGRTPAYARGFAVSRDGVRRAREEARHWRRALRLGERDAWSTEELERAGLLLAFAYPDRIAQRRGGGGAGTGARSAPTGTRSAPTGARYLLRNGRGAALASAGGLAHSAWIVAAEIDDAGREGRIALAAPVALEEIEEHFADQIETDETVAWDAGARAVRGRRRRRLGALVLADDPLRDVSPERTAEALVAAIEAEGLGLLAWSDGARGVRERLAFLHALEPASWPDVSDERLLATLRDWLLPHLGGVRRLDELARVDLGGALLAMLPWERRAALDRLAPTHLTVPSGSRIPIDYADPAAPVLAVRLQEMFGQTETPRVADGRVPLTIHLLSPAHRPVQVTRDLAGFWRTTYFDVRKDLKGRYPTHHWPDDPLAATPTHRAKRRGE